MSTLEIKIFGQDIYDLSTTSWYKAVTFIAIDYYGQPLVGPIIFQIGSTNPSHTPYPMYPDLTTALADVTNFSGPQYAAVIGLVNANAGTTIYGPTDFTTEMVDTAVGAAIAMLATVARTGSYTDLINLPATVNRVANAVTPTLNSPSVISSTRDAFVTYPVDVAVGASLITASSGSVYLDYADNSAMTTNLVSYGPFTNANGGLLGALNTGTVTASGMIPANKYRRVRSVTNSGTVTFTTRQGQEVLL